MTEKVRLVGSFYKWNTPRARWQEIDVGIVGLFYPGYERKYLFSNGQEVIRKPGEPLFDEETGLIPEIDA